MNTFFLSFFKLATVTQRVRYIRAALALLGSVAVSGAAFAQGDKAGGREAEVASPMRVQLSGRLQTQWVGLDTDVSGAAANPAATQHFFARRLYLTARGELGPDWVSNLTYDFAGELFDAAWLQYRGWDGVTVDFGLRKVNLGWEERLSSGSLQAIERSGVTRYFVEGNNGRRLGAGSYRVGAFIDGRRGGFFYGAAITNPERAGDVAAARSAGDGTRNGFAFWANAGWRGSLGAGGGVASGGTAGTYTLGAGSGFLPDQGGRMGGTGHALAVYTVYADLRGLAGGRLGLSAEFLGAEVERGSAGAVARDARPWGYWVQSSVALSAAVELVARYSALNSDGRGVNLSDGVRSAPSGGTHARLGEGFLGANWYLRGNDLKFQAGYVQGESRGAIGGGGTVPARATSRGVRAQMQVQF